MTKRLTKRDVAMMKLDDLARAAAGLALCAGVACAVLAPASAEGPAKDAGTARIPDLSPAGFGWAGLAEWFDPPPGGASCMRRFWRSSRIFWAI